MILNADESIVLNQDNSCLLIKANKYSLFPVLLLQGGGTSSATAQACNALENDYTWILIKQYERFVAAGWWYFLCHCSSL